MIKKFLLLLLILNIYTIPVSSELVAKTSEQNNDYINMTINSNNILTEIILIIPKESLNNVHSINALQFPCSKNFYNQPDNNLIIRFFKYYGFGVFSPLDNSYITPSQCQDYLYQITWNLFLVEEVDHNYDYAFGMYSNNVINGSWEYPYLSEYGNLTNNQSYSWLNISNNNAIINVSIVDMNGLSYTNNSSSLKNYPSFKVLGTLEIPSTPTPTPYPTNTPSLPLNNSQYGTPLNNSTNLNDLNNLSNNPNAINEIYINSNETVGSLMEKAESASLGYTVFGFMIFIIRFFSIKKGD